MRAVTRRAAIALGIGSVLVGAAVAFAATPANTPSPRILDPTTTAGSFYNYDYTSTSCAPTSSPPPACTNVDWPVTMIFKGPTVSVASVTTLLKNAGYNSTGSTEYAYVEQQGATTFQRVSSGGPKHFISTSIHPLINAPAIGWFSSVHIRLYAPSAVGYFSGTNRMHYVIGTPHFDLNELFSPTYGWSEVASEQVAADLVAKHQVNSAAIAYDSVPVNDAEGTPDPNYPTVTWKIIPRKDGTHYWQSSGYATVVTVPS
jgi:hypothetical protein